MSNDQRLTTADRTSGAAISRHDDLEGIAPMELRKLAGLTVDCRALMRRIAALSAGMSTYWSPFARHAAGAPQGPIRLSIS